MEAWRLSAVCWEKAGGRELLVYPWFVEPVAGLAGLGAPDNQWIPEAADAFESFCEVTPAVPLATAEFPFDTPVPAHILTHTGQWIAGCVRQMCPNANSLVLDPDEPIQGGTSGSPVVTEDGLLLGVVSSTGEPGPDASNRAWARSGPIPRPHLAAPVWLARLMVPAGGRRA